MAAFDFMSEANAFCVDDGLAEFEGGGDKH